MDLNQYPPSELQTLLLAVSLANEVTKLPDVTAPKASEQLQTWATRITEALNDSAFAANDLPY